MRWALVSLEPLGGPDLEWLAWNSSGEQVTILGTRKGRGPADGGPWRSSCGFCDAGRAALTCGFSRRYSTWEPEEHILDPRLVMAYEEK